MTCPASVGLFLFWGRFRDLALMLRASVCGRPSALGFSTPCSRGIGQAAGSGHLAAAVSSLRIVLSLTPALARPLFQQLTRDVGPFVMRPPRGCAFEEAARAETKPEVGRLRPFKLPPPPALELGALLRRAGIRTMLKRWYDTTVLPMRWAANS